MRAMPRYLLIHEVTLCKVFDEDRWGKVILDDSVRIKFVRIEPSKQIIRDKNNAEIQLSATLFYDCRNSRPQDAEFSLDDVIYFHGEKYQIKLVEPLYDDERLHHYEIGLVKKI